MADKMNDTSPGSVLIIDDERIDQMQYLRILRQLGMADNVSSFSHTEEALDWLLAHPNDRVDLILLDVNMPRMNAVEFLEKADESLNAAGTTVVVMLSAEPPAGTRARLAAFSSVRAFFKKPLSAEQMLDAVRLVQDRNV